MLWYIFGTQSRSAALLAKSCAWALWELKVITLYTLFTCKRVIQLASNCACQHFTTVWPATPSFGENGFNVVPA